MGDRDMGDLRSIVLRAAVALARELGSEVRIAVVVLWPTEGGASLEIQSNAGDGLPALLEAAVATMREREPDEIVEGLTVAPRLDG